MKSRLTLTLVAAALALVACGKKDEPRTAPPAPPVTKQDVQKSVEPTPPLPPPATTPEKDVELPKPGQANDHSSPAFKAGGTPDPKK
jgi:predicted small lipoprotein YifL